jgi:hypothetical protein
MTDVNAQLRISPWPSAGLPLPERYHVTPCLIRRSHLTGEPVLKWRRGATMDVRLQPGEIYLKLAHTDLDDDAAVERFINRFGLLGLHALKGRYGRSPAHEVAGDARPEPDNPMLARRWRARNALTLDRDAFTDAEETLDEFLGGAYLLRDAITLWQCTDQRLDPETQRFELFDPAELLVGSSLPNERKWEWMLGLLNVIFDAALSPFSPRLIAVHGLIDRGGVKYRPDTPWEFEPLYSVIFLELFNHIATGARHRICANDRCGQPFVRQEGRATKGSHRTTGTLYCSASCARAVAVRAYRERRRRAEDELA